MNSLTVNNRLSQQPGMYEYRPLRHECRLPNSLVVRNHREHSLTVGDESCRSLTAGLGTEGDFMSILFVGNQKLSALSVCARATRMSVLALCGNSGVILLSVKHAGSSIHYAAMLPTVNSTWYAEYGNTIFAPSWSMTPAVSNAVTSRCTARKSRPTRRASSRMDIASAPVMALMMASRFGASIVLASDSMSGNVRENGASTGCPDIAATNAVLVSSLAASRDITRTVSVVIVLPPYSVDIGVKLFEQVSEVGERHRVLVVADMFMVTFASLVVIAHNASLVNNVGHAVLISVVTGTNRGINYPDCNADKGVFPRKDIALFDEQLRWHCVFSLNDDNDNIILLVMSIISSLDPPEFPDEDLTPLKHADHLNIILDTMQYLSTRSRAIGNEGGAA